GAGKFDGAHLVYNFEGLNPANTWWRKSYNVFANVDKEADRYLEFERWWSGFYFMNRNEMLAIVENLFIGNKLEQGQMPVCAGCVADLRRIRAPIIIFASYGDNITPPHQALGWIPAVYTDTEDLKRAEQRIVYLTNPHVGHLGIFVSAKVARLEHRAILESLPEIEALRPGLYEMKIDNPSGDPDCHKPNYKVRFEPRNVEDLKVEYPREAFERVRQVSEYNETIYRTFLSPWVQVFSNPWVAECFKWMHPMRASRYLLSEDFNPWMFWVRFQAECISKERKPLPKDHPLMEFEEELFEDVGRAIERARIGRDTTYEQLFSLLYGELNAGRHAALSASN
ncbi:MAG: DUF3141 domain-containing protein, partial [Rhizobiaceae bacterium]|nr:DUF3141 domain-containing protein [Rhizobiaceae bacterium]